MLRLHSLLLIAFCVPLLVFYMATETTTTQSAYHSLSLNGTSSYASVPNSSSLNISGPITIEAWIRLNAVNGNYQDIVCRESWGQAGSGGGYELAVTNTGKIRLDLYQSHNQYTTGIGSSTITANAWHHVAGVFDGNQIRIYLNGVLDGSVSTTNGPASGTSALHIGKSTYTGYYFGGLIDEVRISAAALYSANFTPGLGPASNTRGLWRFDGQTPQDSSGNNNHATLQGGAVYSTSVPANTNNAPTVTINDPQHNTTFPAGSNVVIDASAADSDGLISQVEFYQGTTLLGSDTTGPYTFIWNNVPGGVYSITAKATDDDGAVTTSSAISINVIDSASQHSLSLNGTSSYASVPNSSSLNISGPITIEAWIRLNAVNGNYQDIVCRESWGQAGSGGGYELAVTNTGKIRLDLYQSHNQYTTGIGSSTITANAWHHVAGVFDGNQIRIYLNGVLDGSVSTTNGPASGTSALHIGKSTYTGYYFGGLIDEVRISAAALYSANFTPGLGPASNTRGLWKFDGQTPQDSSGNGNHATLQNATYSTIVPSQGGAQRPVPVAGGPYNGQVGQAIQFSSSGSFDPDGSIAAYRWNFGDGTSVNSANPTHAYGAPGLYTATLTLTDNTGLRASTSIAVTVSSGTNARLDPNNQIGGGEENPLSRNFNWNLPLVSLPGRAEMHLGLTLSYNSLVWLRDANQIAFDSDNGFPSAGFRLGFPVIQPLYFNSEVGKYAFVLIGSDGSRTELRQIGNSSLYEAADSSHLLLDANTMTLRTTEGTQLSYVPTAANEFVCSQAKDRNGNLITINYTPFGRIDTIVDTLARTIKFNYDAPGRLTSISQIWNQGSPGESTHNWAIFSYTDTTIQRNFGSLTVVGPSNGSKIKTLSQVNLADGSRYDFTYSTWGQVWKVSRTAANQLLSSRSYNLPQTAETVQSDCPRYTERRDWARYWNGDTDGVVSATEEAITSYAEPVSDSWTMPDEVQQSGKRADVTLPDGTVNKIYFAGTAGTASGWRRGLPALIETYEGSVLRRQVMTTWTQDDTAVSYPLNSRVIETNIYDPAGNRARSQITYQQFTFANGTSCHLPRDVYEYAADAVTILRSTRTDYNTSTDYTNRRILGLVSEKRLYEGNVNNGGVLRSKTGFFYDEPGSIQGTDAPIQHENSNYSASFVTGRANLSSVRRYDVNNTSQYTKTSSKYNTAGAVVSAKDASNHEVLISYADAFSDGVARNTLAYPTTVTDPDLYTSSTEYNFDFGSVTHKQTPQPNTVQNLAGPEQSFTYDSIGRLERVTNSVNSAYTRFEYADSLIRVDTYVTIQEGLGEAHTFKITDGAGRVIGTAMDHPGSDGGFSGQKMVFDVMGRLIKTSNPAETDASGAPSQWTTAGDDEAAGWIYTQQTYDWRNRPLIRTNQDGTTRTASYTGCGCAGGSVVTLTDEGTLDAGVAKRRQQKIYQDVLGRTIKTEILNWEGGSVYSATVNTYNARDQLLQTRQYAGPEGSATYQDTTITYDGYGRMQSRHAPEQAAATATHYSYNPDDTISSVIDARGASTNLIYNARHLVTGVSYAAPLSIPTPSQTTFAYDAVGNRTVMTDESGNTTYQYNQLSELASETRTFATLGGSYTLGYEYTLNGALKSLTDHTNQRINYDYDHIGRLSSITGANYNIPQFINSVAYRAWQSPKQTVYGNGRTVSATYNSRMQISHLEMPSSGGFGPVMSIDYQYYNDGRLKYSHDLLDSKLDRSYEYDHVARLIKALSGAEARGEPATNNRPYKETAGYDQLHHLTTRTTLHWSRVLGFGSSDSYTNNRRNGWTYDANGNLKDNGARQYTYDAAGRVTAISAGNLNQFFDGDGQRVKTTEPNLVTYYVRSTVLGGEVIAELNSSGNKQRGFLYAGGRLIAEQAQNGSVSFVHEDTAGISIRKTNASVGNTIEFTELDPWRAEAYASDPYSENPNFSGRGEGGPVQPGFGNISDPSRGCTLDGVYSLCDFISRNENGGGVELQLIAASGKTKQVPIVGSVLGIEAVWVGEDDSTAVTELRGTTDSSVTIFAGAGGHFEFINYNQSLQTIINLQNTKRAINFAFGDASTVLAARMKRNACLEFFTKGRSLEEVSKIFANFWSTGRHDSSLPHIAGTQDPKKGMESRLRVGNAFFSDGEPVYHWSAVNNRNLETTTNLTPRQYRALTILHEFAHALGLLDSDGDKADPSGTQSEKNNQIIYEKCGAIIEAAIPLD